MAQAESMDYAPLGRRTLARQEPTAARGSCTDGEDDHPAVADTTGGEADSGRTGGAVTGRNNLLAAKITFSWHQDYVFKGRRLRFLPEAVTGGCSPLRDKVAKGTFKVGERAVLRAKEDRARVYSMTLNVKSPTLNVKSPTVNVDSPSVI